MTLIILPAAFNTILVKSICSTPVLNNSKDSIITAGIMIIHPFAQLPPSTMLSMLSHVTLNKQIVGFSKHILKLHRKILKNKAILA